MSVLDMLTDGCPGKDVKGCTNWNEGFEGFDRLHLIPPPPTWSELVRSSFCARMVASDSTTATATATATFHDAPDLESEQREGDDLPERGKGGGKEGGRARGLRRRILHFTVSTHI